MIQFVRSSILPALGVPQDVANEVFGAYVNAASYTAQGIETWVEAVAGAVRIVASYMLLDDRAHISLSGYLSGKQDNSTYMFDEFGETSMLLPNHNLLDGYQKIDLSGRYRIRRNLRWYLSVENLLNQRYEAEPGVPALPAAVRTGVAVVFGGSPSATP